MSSFYFSLALSRIFAARRVGMTSERKIYTEKPPCRGQDPAGRQTGVIFYLIRATLFLHCRFAMQQPPCQEKPKNNPAATNATGLSFCVTKNLFIQFYSV